jgi:tetratricopeptide (TPR) repeat protein
MLAAQTDEIVHLVDELRWKILPLSPFEIGRLDSAIRRLGDVDIVASQCFRGVYHALRGDAPNALKWLDMALKTSPDESDIYLNYAVALSHLGRKKEAVSMSLAGISKGDYTPEAISNLLLHAYYADDISVLNEWLPKYKKLTGSPHEVAAWLEEDAEDEATTPELMEESRKGGEISLDRLCVELGL